MIQLVLVFCLATGGAQSCKEVRPNLDAIDSPDACFHIAQIAAINELNTRLDLQGYRLTQWRCVMSGRDERSL